MATIMVLDDDLVILDLLRTVLTDAGHTILAASRFDAIPLGATADLVIIDLIPLKHYRREAALEWVLSVRSRFTGAPLFVVTAHAPRWRSPTCSAPMRSSRSLSTWTIC